MSAAKILIAPVLVGNTQVQGPITTRNQRVAVPSATQSITAVGQAITAAASSYLGVISSDADYTLTATPTITAGTDGEEIILLNVGNFTVTLQDDGTLAGSDLFLLDTTVDVGPRQIIRLVMSSAVGGWVQAGPVEGGGASSVIERYECTGAEGVDFMVTLTVAQPNDQYSVFPALAFAAASPIVGVNCPDDGAGDRTTTQFRVIVSAALVAGDFIDFEILPR